MYKFCKCVCVCVIFFSSLFSFKQILITGMYSLLSTIISSCLMICCYKKCKGRITSWFNRIMQAADDNISVELHPSPISLFVDTSINRPSAANLMVESDHEDEEDPYSNIGLPPYNNGSHCSYCVSTSNCI